MTDLGTPQVVRPLVEEYLGPLPPELLTDDTNALLGALLMELQAQRMSGGGPSDVSVFLEQRRRDLENSSDDSRALYHSTDVTAPKNEWESIELEFFSSEIDLRKIDGAVDVAFVDPRDSGDEAVISYDQADSPLAGIPAETQKVWFRGDGAQRTLKMEAWG